MMTPKTLHTLGWICLALATTGCNKKESQLTSDAIDSSITVRNEEGAASEAGQGRLFDIESLPSTSTETKTDQNSGDLPESPNRLRFTDIASEAGVNFVYRNGEKGQSLMVESTGGGVGALDFDCDGHSDLIFSQGGVPGVPSVLDTPVLYRNVSHSKFVDSSIPSGLEHIGYGQGVAIGDFNSDGFPDVYITCVGANALWENKGDGTFTNVTLSSRTAGVSNSKSLWSSSAAFADLTGDGLLDLYVCQYVDYDPLNPLRCRNAKGENRICHPREVEPLPDLCFVNQGDGTFLEEAAKMGLVGKGNKALGVAIADFTGDGKVDVYVANDTTANFLFVNLGDSRFEERALQLGCAVSGDGLFQASMGLAIGDYDNNRYLDIYSTHYYDESNTLYRNLGSAGFQDVTSRLGLHIPTLHLLAFGTVMHDFDLDSHQDLFVVNGHVENYVGNPIHKMPAQLFQFEGARWIERSNESGEFFASEHVGRGVASLDIDEDGDFDLAVVHQNSNAALLRNDSQTGHWLKLRLIGRDSPRDGYGCRAVVTAGNTSLYQERFSGGSYASSCETSLVFGLGTYDGRCQLELQWPSGKTSSLTNIAIDQELVLVEP